MFNSVNRCGSQSKLAGALINKLTPEAVEDLSALAIVCDFHFGKVVFAEGDAPSGIYLVLDGEVKLSMNSADGRRLIMRVARNGEILGLGSAVSGKAYEMTAEALYPTRIATISRRDFLGFLSRHPEVYQFVTEELSRECAQACEQLRTVGLSSSAPEKLARLLLVWSENGQTTEYGTRFRFSFTHGEIGEFIGASRETVTRTLTAFKNRQLVAFQGSTLTIPNKTALESYARC